MRVTRCPHASLIVALMVEMPMNKGFRRIYEGMGAKCFTTFFCEKEANTFIYYSSLLSIPGHE